ncbi:UdgX family uracil-DNA binding protein [Streptomyces sp. AN091965]|uniref:UdgX family uracil-DNA binding protein n=1 Tax=Streptomyces sp. AN091965 TaxID=2927803 RepID=UPI001F60DBB3|nr:UdgX family uracil-DNA binding protein [Streptomyces sp. AN091965]MCI3935146.1 UdgX family uracil-DNA binding protein [Streptomyces sp. AN091965]
MPRSTGQAADSALPYVPARGGIPALRRAAAGCRGCPLYAEATQTVFGAGPARARLMLVGEQPGDQEDRAGEPFVGPAGRLLRSALDEAGIDAEQAYFTNAVKHFKFAPVTEGRKRRIHKAPSLGEMAACRPWLAAEIKRVDPELVVALGATAGKSLLGNSFKVTASRGALLSLAPGTDLPLAEEESGSADDADRRLLATVHPSAVLRSKDRDEAFAGLVSDLRVASRFLG